MQKNNESNGESLKKMYKDFQNLEVNDEFLEWLKKVGNDLITPHPEFGFPGLKNGDRWCVCASWYARALEENKACPIYLKRTHENTLKLISIDKLKKLAIDLS